MHDVDDQSGVGCTLKRILRGDQPYQLWVLSEPSNLAEVLMPAAPETQVSR
jgi:hypothetical protein